MAITATGRAALVSREALKTTAYKDSVGIWTIGVGHTSAAGPPTVTPGLVITQAEALDIFARDLVQYEAAVDQAVTVPMADHERDALVSICYNIGPGGFRKSTFVKRLNAGDRAGCAAAIMSWRKPSEIISRRTAERDQFLTPYSVALPKARSNDRSAVRVGAAPAVKPAPVVSAPPVAIEAPRVQTVSPVPTSTPWWQRFFGVKAKPASATVVRPGLRPNGDPALWDVQAKLREKAYYTKGELDGLDGGLTQGAVAQIRKDNGLGDGGIDAEFLATLDSFPQRPVSIQRQHMSLPAAAAHAPELFKPPGWLVSAGLGSLGLGGASGAGLMDNVQTAVAKGNDVFGQVQTAFAFLTSVVAFVVEHKTWFLVAVGLFLVWKGVSAILGAWIKVRQAFF
jgi:lysozyme